ncbi:hypothetical protein ACTS94_11925 [Empedobacter falsenii]
MKKLTLVLLLTSTFALCQEKNSDEQIILGTTARSLFIKNGETYKLNQYKQVFENPNSINYIKKARSNKTFGTILSTIGGFGIGFGTGMFIANLGKGNSQNIYEETTRKGNRESGLIYLGMGLGITATSIPLWIGYNKNIKKAVDLENKTTTYSSSLNFSLNENGYGLAFKF